MEYHIVGNWNLVPCPAYLRIADEGTVIGERIVELLSSPYPIRKAVYIGIKSSDGNLGFIRHVSGQVNVYASRRVFTYIAIEPMTQWWRVGLRGREVTYMLLLFVQNAFVRR